MDRELLHRALLETIGGGELSDCDLCVELMSQLKAHILSHNSRHEPPSPIPEVITSHAKEKRVIVKPHHCFRCKQSFEEASHLSKHILHHVRQKENGKVNQKKVFKLISAPNPTSNLTSRRRRHFKVPEVVALTSTPATTSWKQVQSTLRNNRNKLESNQARVSYIIRTRRSVIRTRLSSRLTINEQDQQREKGLEAEESVLTAETVVNSLPVSSTSTSDPSRVSDSCFIGSSHAKSSSKALSQGIGDDNNMIMPPPVWQLGRLSKNTETEPKESSVTSLDAIHRRQNPAVTGNLFAPETMTHISLTSSSDNQIIPESVLIDNEAQSLGTTNRGLSSGNHTSGSDLIYASILMPTPPRKLGLRFPTKKPDRL